MSDCCNIPNPLLRDGVSQRQRQAAALSPDTVPIDDRHLADFLVFAYRLARQVNYTDVNHQPAGDWRAFFTTGSPVWLALIHKTSWAQVNQTYQAQREAWQTQPEAATLRPMLQTWATMLSQLRLWFTALQNDTPLKATIRGLVNTNLAEPLSRMQGFDRAYAAATGMAAIAPDFYADFHRTVVGTPGLSPDPSFYQGFADTFGLALAEPRPDAAPLTRADNATQTALDEVFQVVFQNYRQVIQLAPQFLAPSLAARQDHPPHLALYLSFLAVFQQAQTDLNRLSQKHLDFFYRQVLRLPARPAQPDRAHVLIELAKVQTEYALPANRRFKAGKDAGGAEVFYHLDREVVFDKAQVRSLSGLFLARRTEGTQRIITGLHVSPVANSADGRGEPFAKDVAVPAWLPFGDAHRDRAEIGLAIASPLFALAEGTRTLTLRFALSPLPATRPTPSQLAQGFQISLSGETEWINAKTSQALPPIQWQWDGNTLQLTVKLGPELGAIVPYHADLPGASLPTVLPVLRLILRDPDPTPQAASTFTSLYHFFQGVKFSQVEITTEVDAVRNLLLQNDLAVLDATKPFPPFGPQPKAGNTLYIGSQEVFQKPLTRLQLHLTWEANAPDWASHYAGYGDTAPNPGTVLVQALRGKTWHPTPAPSLTRTLFGTLTTALTGGSSAAALNRLKLSQFEATEPLTPWTHQSQNGFLRLQLTGDDFRHSAYSTVLSRQVLAQAMAAMPTPQIVVGAYYWVGSGNDRRAVRAPNDAISTSALEPVIPNEPFTPVLQSIYLSYTARATLTLAQLATTQIGQCFHLHPSDRFITLAAATTDHLLPQFQAEGELCIGLENLQPLTTLNLLVQVAEETADTALETAEVAWHYLSDNTWKLLEAHQIVSDGTTGLIGSGIVQIAIPADIRRQHTTRLDPALHWLKVSVPDRSRAIPHIIGIHAQAAAVTFVNAGNDLSRLATPLPADTLSKLAEPQPEIKAIAQPYPSQDGRPPERDRDYITRISEHLRHKGRAATIFDYERLVLERFPDIYKVRCINHGQVGTGDRLQELVPGAVTLAVIPDLSNRRTTNDLQPKVNINRLTNIKQELERLTSAWVELQVVNPRYEEIQVEFEVRFKDPYEGNFAYYQRQLEAAIVGFLSPWTVSDGADIHFGGKVYRSSILNFVEEQPTVDYVLNFKMHQGSQRDIREFIAPTARSILVSIPPSSSPGSPGHLITRASACPGPSVPSHPTLGYTPLTDLTLTPAPEAEDE